MKPRDLLPLVAFLAAAAGPASAATTGGIEGTVVDQVSSQVVGGGKVAIAVTCGTVRKSAAVDGVGHFSVGGLPAGACTLSASGALYVTATLGVTVVEGAFSTILVSVTTKAYMEQVRKQQEAQRREWQKESKNRRYQMDLDGGMAGGDMGAGRGAVRGAPGMAREPMPAPMVAPPRPASPPRDAPRPAKPVDAVAKAPPPPPPAGARPDAPAKAKAQIVRLPANEEKADKRAMDGERENNRIAGRRRPQAEAPMIQQANGWAPVRVFPVPQYTRGYDGPRSDFRETVYWNPAVETDGNGVAEVTFVASDAVTSFRASAEGFSAAGAAGAGHVTFQSKLPMTLDARLPTEVTSGDTVRLPITLANETSEAIDATLTTSFGAAFKLTTSPVTGTIKLAANAKQTLFFPLEVVATGGNSDIEIRLTARGLNDEIKKTIRVVPRGFPIEVAASGTAKKGQAARHTLDLAGAMPGSIQASVTMYPSPVAAMTKGMDAMIREPGGCFEQASSTNYPNIMILGYLNSTDAADPALVAKTQGVLTKGYKLLTGYETSQKGYEWFGQTPGHEALTAYGLMQFADMAKVFDVDRTMVERTASWLMSRRDSQGGFQRSTQALDSFGRASPTTTNAYIMWALAEAKRTGGLTKELAMQTTLGGETRDPYLLALATNTQLAAAPKAADGPAMAKRLVGLQAKDGSFTGAKETITMSGGDSLTIETTALAVLALLKASPNSEYEAQIRAGVDWLNSKRGGYGSWGNTQATILGLKALTAYTEHARQMASPGSATLIVNGKDAGTIKFDKGRRDALVWDDLAGKLAPGKNTIEVRLEGNASLPYSVAISYRSASPASSPRTKIAMTTQLLATKAKMGEGVTLRTHVENTTNAGIPMTLARVGIPGGMVFQTWQLKELRDKGLIDFYETRPREVILYWRAMAPGAKKDVDINLLAAVPGTYEAPASSAYLYYTAEDKTWTKPVSVTIEK